MNPNNQPSISHKDSLMKKQLVRQLQQRWTKVINGQRKEQYYYNKLEEYRKFIDYLVKEYGFIIIKGSETDMYYNDKF